MKKISLLMILSNLFMFWDEQPPVVLMVALIFAFLSLFEYLIEKDWVKTLFTTVLMGIGALVIKANFQPFLSAESVVAMIMFLASIKLFELKNQTDYFHLFLILNLELSSLLILKPTFFTLIYVLGQLGLSFYFVLRLNKGFLKQLNLKRVLLFFAPALPLGFLFFFLFPRFTSGFNQAPNPSQVESGFSDRIDLEFLRPMNLSTQSVFKVKFEGEATFSRELLYWRGAVLWDTDGKSWTANNYTLINRRHSIPALPENSKTLRYELFLEPGNKNQIFLLDYPLSIDLGQERYRQFFDGTFEFRHQMFFKNTMKAESVIGVPDTLMNKLIKRKGLKVGRYQSSPKIKKFLHELYDQKALSNEEKIFKLNHYFKTGGFTYTLTPPPYTTLSQFLFTSKEGYCSHFATTYALLARLSGIPARVISGFQGGEFNSYGGYYRIEGKDAHAWVEVFLEQKGWIRIDPTELVSPGRITLGAAVFNDQMQPYYEVAGLKLEKAWFQYKALDEVRKYVDSLNNSISSFFYNFDYEYQRLLSERFKIERRYLGLIAVLSLIFFLGGSYFIMMYLNRYQSDDVALREYKLLLRELERKGIVKALHEGPQSFKLKVQESLPKGHEDFCKRIDKFIQAKYEKPDGL